MKVVHCARQSAEGVASDVKMAEVPQQSYGEGEISEAIVPEGEMAETAQTTNRGVEPMEIQFLKFEHLQVVRGSKLEKHCHINTVICLLAHPPVWSRKQVQPRG